MRCKVFAMPWEEVHCVMAWCQTLGMIYLDMMKHGYNDTLHGSDTMFNTGH